MSLEILYYIFSTQCIQLLKVRTSMGQRSFISSVVDNNEHHLAMLGCFVIVALFINVLTYLLT